MLIVHLIGMLDLTFGCIGAFGHHVWQRVWSASSILHLNCTFDLKFGCARWFACWRLYLVGTFDWTFGLHLDRAFDRPFDCTRRFSIWFARLICHFVSTLIQHFIYTFDLCIWLVRLIKQLVCTFVTTYHWSVQWIDWSAQVLPQVFAHLSLCVWVILTPVVIGFACGSLAILCAEHTGSARSRILVVIGSLASWEGVWGLTF